MTYHGWQIFLQIVFEFLLRPLPCESFKFTSNQFYQPIILWFLCINSLQIVFIIHVSEFNNNWIALYSFSSQHFSEENTTPAIG